MLQEGQRNVKAINTVKGHCIHNKTLGRAQDPRANGAWLSKLTE